MPPRTQAFLLATLALVAACATAAPGGLPQVRLAPLCAVGDADCRPDALPLDTASLRSPFFPPPALRGIGVGALATLEFTVRGDGTVDSSSIVVKSSTLPTFSTSAALAISRWRFQVGGARRAQLPARMAVQLELNFPGHRCGRPPAYTWHWYPDLQPRRLVVRACTQELVPAH